MKRPERNHVEKVNNALEEARDIASISIFLYFVYFFSKCMKFIIGKAPVTIQDREYHPVTIGRKMLFCC